MSLLVRLYVLATPTTHGKHGITHMLHKSVLYASTPPIDMHPADGYGEASAYEAGSHQLCTLALRAQACLPTSASPLHCCDQLQVDCQHAESSREVAERTPEHLICGARVACGFHGLANAARRRLSRELLWLEAGLARVPAPVVSTHHEVSVEAELLGDGDATKGLLDVPAREGLRPLLAASAPD